MTDIEIIDIILRKQYDNPSDDKIEYEIILRQDNIKLDDDGKKRILDRLKDEQICTECDESFGGQTCLELTPKGREIISKYGSYAKYLVLIEKQESEESELIALQKKNLKLQNESLEYKQTIRDQEQRIRNLEERLQFLSIVKKYWWLIGSSFLLGAALANYW